MFRHILLAKFTPEATESERLAMREAMQKLPSQVKEVIAARCGVDVGRGPNHYDFGIVFDFEDREGLKRSIASPALQAYVQGPARGRAVVAAPAHMVIRGGSRRNRLESVCSLRGLRTRVRFPPTRQTSKGWALRKAVILYTNTVSASGGSCD